MANAQSGTFISLLLVEDDSLVCKSIGRMIAREFPAVMVYTAENGQSGLELFKKHTPDIVVTDINLPIMDGIEMAGEIKRLKADTRLIVLTGYSDNYYLETFNKIGFYEYLIKPVNFVKLFATIEKCCTEIALQQQE